MTSEEKIRILKMAIKDAIWAIDVNDLKWARKILSQANNILNPSNHYEEA